jgi:ubiquinone/menaquinone biosynthesis C-methylase UbiE
MSTGTAVALRDAGFDLVVSSLTLIDIPEIEAAVRAMARVFTPGGTLMIATAVRVAESQTC